MADSTYDIVIIFTNGFKTTVKDVEDWGYKDLEYFFKKNGIKHFIPNHQLMYIGPEDIEFELVDTTYHD